MRSRRRRYAFAVIAVSILVDFFRARTLERVAEKTSSQALEADALHFSSDMWSSIAVLIGLGGVALGYPWADAGGRPGRRGVHLHRRLAARPPHHRHVDRHGAGGRQRESGGDRAAGARRRRCRAGARAAGRRSAVRRSCGRRQPHAAARSRHRHQGSTGARHPRRISRSRSHHHHRAARARRRDGARTRDADRPQQRARGPSRRRAGDWPIVCRFPPTSKSKARCRSRPRTRRRAGSKKRSARNSGRMWRSRPISSRCRRSLLAGRDATGRACDRNPRRA